ncbi:phosphatase PAP2 family protein [Candidatus Pacearchaeota archaeon]|nr:phosphatase PAP2 family protein [Candidatus Pacearchaeota archaeon]
MIDLTQVMKAITTIGNPLVLLSLIIVFFLVLHLKKKDMRVAALALGGGLVLEQILKFSIQRQRPDHPVIKAIGYSFPSGHAMMSMIFFGLIMYLFSHSIRSKAYRILFIMANCLLILLIGISRVYLGVHYITDVIGGFIIGLVWLLTSIKIVKHLRKKSNN